MNRGIVLQPAGIIDFLGIIERARVIMTGVIVRLISQIPCKLRDLVYAEGLSRFQLRGVETLCPSPVLIRFVLYPQRIRHL